MKGKHIFLVLGTALLLACTAEPPLEEMQAAAGDDVGDIDGDGTTDSDDNCVAMPNPAQDDVDGDQVGDECDVCPDDVDPEQGDEDEDGQGDACELEGVPLLDTDLTPVSDFPGVD